MGRLQMQPLLLLGFQLCAEERPSIHGMKNDDHLGGNRYWDGSAISFAEISPYLLGIAQWYVQYCLNGTGFLVVLNDPLC